MKTVYDYDLHVTGIYGRKRKAQRGLFTLIKHSEVKLTPEAAIELAKAELEKIKLKGSYRLFERVGELDDHFYSTTLKFGQAPLWSGSTI